MASSGVKDTVARLHQNPVWAVIAQLLLGLVHMPLVRTLLAFLIGLLLSVNKLGDAHSFLRKDSFGTHRDNKGT